MKMWTTTIHALTGNETHTLTDDVMGEVGEVKHVLASGEYFVCTFGGPYAVTFSGIQAAKTMAEKIIGQILRNRLTDYPV